MQVYTCNPLDDPRWAQLVESHPDSSAFHTVAWLEALHRTYRYEPVVFTTCAPGSALANGIVLCEVRSWLTGRRLVSLPFADHCEPLIDDREDRKAVLDVLRGTTLQDRRYVELRPLNRQSFHHESLHEWESFHFHTLDLRPTPEELLHGFHSSTIRRKINRARREGVSCVDGRSEELLREFFRLMLLTRRRHGLPPQPIDWFRNVLACFGERATIRVASVGGRAIAAILTLRHRHTLVYKYGCSDAVAHPSGAMPLLFWTTIQDGKANGALSLDLGRSDLSNTGLATFKERLGGSPSTITYVRFDARNDHPHSRRRLRMPRRLVARLPDRVLAAAGRLLYRHLG